MARTDDFLYFRLRIPRILGDLVTDRAYAARRSVNAEMLLLLEKALGVEGLTGTEKTTMRGAKGVGSAGLRAGVGRTGLPLPDLLDDGAPASAEPPPGPRRSGREMFDRVSAEEKAELLDMAERIQKILGAPGVSKAAKPAKKAPSRASSSKATKPARKR